MADQNHMTCADRDRIILAFLLAMNEGNNALSDLEAATNETERSRARKTVDSARSYSHHLRSQVLVHCQSHGC